MSGNTFRLSLFARALFPLLMAALFLTGCPGGDDKEPKDKDAPCADHNCGANGQCIDTEGEASCRCDEGYSGDRCANCAEGYAEWPVASGRCVDDTCLPDPCTGDNRVAGSCQQTSETGFTCTCSNGYSGDNCQSCAVGFAEWPQNSGTCVDDPCLPDPCSSGHGLAGSCVQTGAATYTCDCAAGYVGEGCTDCDTGYTEWPVGSGTCVDDPCLPDPCDALQQVAGSCAQSGEDTYICDCQAGYTGDNCDNCENGYTEWPAGGGSCVDDPCLPDPCVAQNQIASTCVQRTESTYACDCATGYGGDLCAGCDVGFAQWPLGSGVCSDDPCLPDPCTGSRQLAGSCAQDGETAFSCSCEQGYTGMDCDNCDSGYIRWPDDAGVCVDDLCAPDPCTAAGQVDSSCVQTAADTYTCECEPGYSGATCADCAAGYHDDNGTCVEDDVCLLNTCHQRGNCDDSSGTPVCECDEGYAGDHCESCAPGTIEWPPYSAVCVADPCQPDPCVGDGYQEESCVRQEGMTRFSCSCEADYEFDPPTGMCVLTGSFVDVYRDLVPADAAQTYKAHRFSLIEGSVVDTSGTPLVGISVAALELPEHGTAITDSEGQFTLPINGGGAITLVYGGADHLTVHRRVNVTWGDIVGVGTVVLTEIDTVATTVDFNGDASTVITHRGSEVVDEHGSRSATTVFTGDNVAYELDENGERIGTLGSITTRTTEYRTPEAMPAVLPPQSAFTYCAELSVDGMERVDFEKPVLLWVDNFLGFEVGVIVPVGFYDRDLAKWVPADNGVVVRLLDTDSDGVADAYDETDDGEADGPATGLDDNSAYPPDATFWRVEVPHFSPWDCNWPYAPPEDAVSPNPDGDPEADQQLDDDCNRSSGSYVEERSRILHEDIHIPGTDLTLHYASNRVEGFTHQISVPISGASVPSSLERIVVEVTVAGRKLRQELEALPDQIAHFEWDGYDRWGNYVDRTTVARVRVGYAYRLVYTAGSNFRRAFGQVGNELTAVRGRRDFVSWRTSKIELERRPARSDLFKGWTLSKHHWMQQGKVPILHRGDGSKFQMRSPTVTSFAGGTEHTYGGDGGPAIEAQFHGASGIVVDPEGNVIVSDMMNQRVRKIDTEGIVTTIAGTGTEGYSGDGGLATEAELNHPGDLELDSEGNLYIADTSNSVIRRVDSNGFITTYAGNGERGYNGDNIPAVEASFYFPVGLALGPDGSMFVADMSNRRVRKIDPEGIITTVAGTGTFGFSGDGGPATAARLRSLRDVAISPSGELYIADHQNERIRKVDHAGIITTVAGTGARGITGDEGPATEAQLCMPSAISFDPQGNLFIVQACTQKIRIVDTSGIISLYAGSGNYCSQMAQSSQPALEACFGEILDVALSPNGEVYVAATTMVRTVTQGPTQRGSKLLSALDWPNLHLMSPGGRHTSTIDALSGVTLLAFGYNADNALTSITDRFGGQTLVNRDVDGVPQSITSPDGLVTTLTADADGTLTDITYPDGASYSFEYNSGDLLTVKIDPAGNRYEHSYDAIGRLQDVTDDHGGHWQYSSVRQLDGSTLTQVSTAEQNTISYLDEHNGMAGFTTTITGEAGQTTRFTRSGDQMQLDRENDCSMVYHYEKDLDPEYETLFDSRASERTPAGITRSVDFERIYEDTDSDGHTDLSTVVTTVNGHESRSVTDLQLGTTTHTSAEGRTWLLQFDPATQLITTMSVPTLEETSYAYNERGRLVSVTTGVRHSSMEYDAAGNLSSLTNPAGETTSYRYDQNNRLSEIERSDGGLVSFAYDLNGNTTRITTPGNADHVFTHNAIDEMNSYQTPLSGGYTYTYDAERRLQRTVMPSGATIENVYTDGRLTRIELPEGNIELSYTCGTLASSITRGGEEIHYDYDGELLLTETSSGTLNHEIGHSYNNEFRTTSTSYAGATEAFAYDLDGQLTSAGAYTVERNGDTGLPDAVLGGDLRVDLWRNGYGEVAAADLSVDGTTAASWTVTHNNAGRIASKMETIDGTSYHYTYSYDLAGRLASVTLDGTEVESYQYDLDGTRVHEVNTRRSIAGQDIIYNNEEQLVSVGAVTYNYDLDGFLTRKTEQAEITDYTLSSRGELLNVTLPDGTHISYIVDPLGRRIAKLVEGTIVAKYLWQGLTKLLAVYDGDDALIARFEYAGGRLPVAMTQSGVTYYLFHDQVGSCRAVYDSDGLLVKRVDYDTFGNILADTAPGMYLPLGYAGGLHDRDTGMIHFGYRDYDPETGRFTAKDPLLFITGETDLYGYASNDPVNMLDPAGLLTEEAQSYVNQSYSQADGSYSAWDASLTMRRDDPTNLAKRDAEHYLYAREYVEEGDSTAEKVGLATMMGVLTAGYSAYKITRAALGNIEETLKMIGIVDQKYWGNTTTPTWNEFASGFEGAWDGLMGKKKPCP